VSAIRTGGRGKCRAREAAAVKNPRGTQTQLGKGARSHARTERAVNQAGVVVRRRAPAFRSGTSVGQVNRTVGVVPNRRRLRGGEAVGV